MHYSLSKITPDQFQLACDIMTAHELAHNPEFGSYSIDEMQMFFTSRASLTGHTMMMTLANESEPVSLISICEDPARKKFWTASAWRPEFDLADLVVDETINLARSLHSDWKLQPNVTVSDSAHIQAYISRGFHEIQRSYAMRIEFTNSPEYPCLPVGYSLRTVKTEDDWISFHALVNDSFQNHFGFVKRELEDFRSFRLDSKAYDSDGIFILTDSSGSDVAFVESTDEIVDMNMTFVHTVGVVQSHHKQGLGKVMMAQAFAHASSKGRKGAELYVDIANSSGALRFYESLGMKAISAIACLDNPQWAEVEASTRRSH